MPKPTVSFTRTPSPIRWLRECLAISLWITFVFQALVFDLIGYLSRLLHLPEWVVTYRSLVLLGVTIVLWISLGNARFIRFAGYIIFYPLVIIFWHIPRLCLRNWPILAALSPAIISFMRSFRFSFAVYGLSVISAFIIFLAKDKWPLITAMLLIGCMLIVHYFRQLKTVFVSKTVFATMSVALTATWEKLKTSNAFVPPANIDTSTKEGKDKFGASLISMYFFTAGLGKVARGMRIVAASRKLDLLLLLSWCVTVCLTIIAFAFLFLGLERAYPGSFRNSAGFMSFLGYSLCVLTTSDLSHVQPLSNAARVLSFVELGGSIFVLILMVFLILTSLRDRFRYDFERITFDMETTAGQFETLLTDNYKLTLHAAEEWLMSYSSFVARHLLRLRHDKTAIATLEAAIQGKTKEGEKKA